VVPDSRIADVIRTALDRPLPHLAFLDLSMDGAQHLPLRSTWTQHTGLKALSLLESQWTSQQVGAFLINHFPFSTVFPGNQDGIIHCCTLTPDHQLPIGLSRLRVENPANLQYTTLVPPVRSLPP
jgi:hypothetical protein